jgi:hypothetical protein
LMTTDLPICANPLAGALMGRSPVATGIGTACSESQLWRQYRKAAPCNDYTQGTEGAASSL